MASLTLDGHGIHTVLSRCPHLFFAACPSPLALPLCLCIRLRLPLPVCWTLPEATVEGNYFATFEQYMFKKSSQTEDKPYSPITPGINLAEARFTSCAKGCKIYSANRTSPRITARRPAACCCASVSISSGSTMFRLRSEPLPLVIEAAASKEFVLQGPRAVLDPPPVVAQTFRFRSEPSPLWRSKLQPVHS